MGQGKLELEGRRYWRVLSAQKLVAGVGNRGGCWNHLVFSEGHHNQYAGPGAALEMESNVT